MKSSGEVMIPTPIESALRCECLKAALELRAGSETPDTIIARAKIFESYVIGDNRAVGAAFGGAISPATKRG